MRMMYKIPDDVEGVLVVSVDPKSNAFSKRIQEGMVIGELNGQSINSVSDFRKQVAKIKKGDPVSVYIPNVADGIYIYFRAG